MAVLYTTKEMQEVLTTLRIKPKEGKVTTEEAAKILTWRVKAERGMDFEYTPSAVRRRIQLGSLKAEPEHKRLNRYRVEDIFDLSLAPGRGSKRTSHGSLHDDKPEQER